MTRPKVLYHKDIKEFFNERGLQCSDDVLEALKNEILQKLYKAKDRAVAEGRSRVLERDI